jgi:hypothetical protein
VSAVAAVGLTLGDYARAAAQAGIPSFSLPEKELRALAAAILPSEVPEEDRERIVSGFIAWAESYRAEADRELGYGTSDIRITAEDPKPRWIAQLGMLEERAIAEFSRPIADLTHEEVRRLIRSELAGDQVRGLPAPGNARHVAVALLSYFYGRPETTDLCYGVSISPNTCRGLHSVTERPTVISTVSWS